MCREGSAGGGSVLSGDGAALNLRGAHPFRLLAHPPTRTSTLLLTRGSPHPRRPPDLSRVTAPQAFFLGGGKQRAAPRRRRTPTETPGGGGAKRPACAAANARHASMRGSPSRGGARAAAACRAAGAGAGAWMT